MTSVSVVNSEDEFPGWDENINERNKILLKKITIYKLIKRF